MIGGIKTIKVRLGKESEFESLFQQLKTQVKLSEPGNKYYDLYRSQGEPGKYIVMECYQDEAALDIHKNSIYGAEFFPKIRTLIETIDVEYFISV